MGMRYFTKKFGSYAIALYEKKYGKDPMSLIDVGNLSIEKMITAIRVGNGTKGNDFTMSEEEAASRIDNFLEDENNSIIDVYLQLIDEYDRDIKLFKGTGVTIDSIRADLYNQVENKTTTENKVVDFPVNEMKQAAIQSAVLGKPVGQGDTTEHLEKIAENLLLPNETPQKVGVDGAVTLDSEPVPQF